MGDDFLERRKYVKENQMKFLKLSEIRAAEAEARHIKDRDSKRLALLIVAIFVCLFFYRACTSNKNYHEKGVIDHRYEDDPYWEDDACPAPY